jgi:hypothetical protein
LELTIPDRIEAGPTYVVSRVSSFLNESADLRTKMIAELESLLNNSGLSSDSADNLLRSGSEHSDLWAEMIEDHFPAGSHGSASLLFYLLPDCTISSLLGLEPGALSSQSPHGLAAVLKR